MLFVSFLKHNCSDFCMQHLIWNFKFPAECCYGSCIKSVKPQIYSHCQQFKVFRVKSLQTMESAEQCKRVFSAGNPHGNFIPVLDHLIFINGFSRITEKLLQLHKNRILRFMSQNNCAAAQKHRRYHCE